MRAINKKRYLIAGILTVVIFSVGILIGMGMDEQRLSYLKDINRRQEVEIASLQLQYVYLNQLSPETFCTVSDKAIKNNLYKLDEILSQLENFKKKTTFNEESYRWLQRQYIIYNLRYWFLIERRKELCNKTFVTALYFYTEKCDQCELQGFILTQLRRSYNNLLVFPLNLDINEPMVQILKERYNITSVPSVVVDGEVHEGFVEYSEMKEIIGKELNL